MLFWNQDQVHIFFKSSFGLNQCTKQNNQNGTELGMTQGDLVCTVRFVLTEKKL